MVGSVLDQGSLRRRGVIARLRGDDRGVAATIVLFPLFAASVFMLVQAIFWQNDRQVAAAAADNASAAVAMYGATSGQAQADAIAQMESAGLRNVSVSVSRGADSTSVVVSGEAPGLLSGMSITVTARSTTPSEGYRGL